MAMKELAAVSSKLLNQGMRYGDRVYDNYG